MSFWSEYGAAIIFYAIIFTLIYFNRKKFDFQAKVIALYRTRIGLKTMKWFGERFAKVIGVIGVIGIVVGFAGMILAVYTIIEGVVMLITTPSAPPAIAPIIPGVKVPGSPLFVPFWYGIIAIFISVVIHEFSHGVVAASKKYKIQSSGFAMFAIIPAAFVEFDEKKLAKKPRDNLAVSAAGPFSNIVLAFLLIVLFGFTPGLAAGIDQQYNTKLLTPQLIEFNDKVSLYNYMEFDERSKVKTGYVITTMPGMPAAQAGIANMTAITIINGVSGEENFELFEKEIQSLVPGQEITIGNATHNWTLITETHPQNASRGYMGVNIPFFSAKDNEELKEEMGVWFDIHKVLREQILWIFIISLGLGIANLLPLGPVDGGRMLLVALEKFFKKERARMIWAKVSLTVFAAIILLLVTPILRAVFSF